MEPSKKLYPMFLDLEAAFDCVDWEEIMKIMRKVGTEENLILNN